MRHHESLLFNITPQFKLLLEFVFLFREVVQKSTKDWQKIQTYCIAMGSHRWTRVGSKVDGCLFVVVLTIILTIYGLSGVDQSG